MPDAQDVRRVLAYEEGELCLDIPWRIYMRICLVMVRPSSRAMFSKTSYMSLGINTDARCSPVVFLGLGPGFAMRFGFLPLGYLIEGICPVDGFVYALVPHSTKLW